VKIVSKIVAKIRDQRNDFQHKLSAKIVEKHDTICVEDLCLKDLVKTKLGKSFLDAGLGSFLRMREYKAKYRFSENPRRFAPGQVIRVGRFFSSSKTCSGCGGKQHLEMSDREWECLSCGIVHDRDINAAKNILAEGLRLLSLPKENAPVKPVRNRYRNPARLQCGVQLAHGTGESLNDLLRDCKT